MTDISRGRKWRWSVAVAVLSIGCDPGEVTVSRPSLTGAAGQTLEVTVTRNGEPQPGATVRHVRLDLEQYFWTEATTDSAGVARSPSDGGFLWVVAEWEGEGGQIWSGGEKIQMRRSGDATLEVQLFSPRTGGVVISEIYMNAPQPWETGDYYYRYGKYIELANNGNHTVYLDGMLLGKAYPVSLISQLWDSTCGDNEHLRNDSAGVWSPVHWRIPGSGSEHPLAPGEVALIAVVAADHREIHPTMLDLSQAEFEFGENGVADNPSAPNLEWVGPELPRGSDLSLAWAFWVLSAAVNVSELPIVEDWTGIMGDQGIMQRRLPAERIEDVSYIWYDRTGGYSQTPPSIPCHDPVHPNFDRIPGGFMKGSELELSAQRRRVTVDGRPVLLDTNTSAVDFMRAERTPGWLP